MFSIHAYSVCYHSDQSNNQHYQKKSIHTRLLHDQCCIRPIIFLVKVHDPVDMKKIFCSTSDEEEKSDIERRNSSTSMQFEVEIPTEKKL